MRWIIASLLALMISSPALAHHRHPLPKHHHHRTIDRLPSVAQECRYDNNGRSTCFLGVKRTETATARQETALYGRSGTVIGGRPSGCPHAYCGCSASLYLFGRIIPELNLASNWIRKFPGTHPAPGMAAARNHHVMVLISQVSGFEWLVHDGNSGHGLTREHVRSISGYVIINPRAGRYASL